MIILRVGTRNKKSTYEFILERYLEPDARGLEWLRSPHLGGHTGVITTTEGIREEYFLFDCHLEEAKASAPEHIGRLEQLVTDKLISNLQRRIHESNLQRPHGR